MDIVSNSPLLVTTRPYRTVRGARFVLIVCKATFLLTPTTATLGGTQEPIHDDDKRWDDKSDRSLFAPSDLVPFKRDIDVVLVGHAFAPNNQPAKSIMTRLCVGEIDKSIEAFGDRLFTPHGELREGPRITRARLRYERATGGPGTSNPVGMRHDKKDLFGAIAMASLQPPGLHVTRPEDLSEPVGYGPIAPEWPMRASRLGHLANTFSASRWFEGPFPDDLDPSFFNAAPLDQRLRELRPDERIVLEGLVPEQPRFVTQLPALVPQAIIERVSGRRDPLQLRADTLWIDTSRRVCTVTWRANVALTQPSDDGRVVVTLGAPETSRVVSRLDPALLAMPMKSGDLDEDTLSINLQGQNRPVTPFSPHAIAAPDTLELPDDPALVEDDAITFVQSDAVKSNTLPFVAAQNNVGDRSTNLPPAPAFDKALPFASAVRPPAPSSPALPFVTAPGAPPPVAPPAAPPSNPSRDLPFFSPVGPSSKSASGVFSPPGGISGVFPAPPPVPPPSGISGVFPAPPPIPPPPGISGVFPAPPPVPPPPAISGVFPAPPPVPPPPAISGVFPAPPAHVAASPAPPPVFPVPSTGSSAPSTPPPPVFPVQPPVATAPTPPPAPSFSAPAITSAVGTLGMLGGASSKPLSAPPPPPPPSALDTPPAAPPMIGPLATPSMVARPPAATAGEVGAASPEAKTEAATPARVDEDDSIERCARITASIARRKDDRAKILDAEKLDAERFAAMQARWNSAISAETDRGKTKLLEQFDQAYVERLEQERGPIRAEEFARLVVSAERGHPDVTLRELGLPSTALMRVERVFLRRSSRDMELSQRLLKAIDAERDA